MAATGLLDAYGRPIRQGELSRELAAPTLAGVRTIWTGSVAAGLTPERLARVLRSAVEGDAHDYLTLAEELEERDGHYASVLGTRKHAVSGLEPTSSSSGITTRTSYSMESCDRRGGTPPSTFSRRLRGHRIGQADFPIFTTATASLPG